MSAPSNRTCPPVGSISRISKRPERRFAAARIRRPGPASRRAQDREATRRRPRATARCGERRSRRCAPGNAWPARSPRPARVMPRSRAARMQAAAWPGASAASGGRAARQASAAKPQRGAKRQPGGRRAGSGSDAGDRHQPRACPAPASARIPAGRACRDAPGWSNSTATGASLDDAAGVHHQHAVGGFRDHAHVVGDDDDRHAELVAQVEQQVEHLRLDGDVERGGRLVGDQQARPAGERHGDHHPLAHAAGQLVRVVAEPLRRRGNADAVQHLQRAQALLARRRARSCARSVSMIWSPMVNTGLSEVIGSWKIIEMPWPRMRSSRASDIVVSTCAVEAHLARRRRAPAAAAAGP